MRVFSTGPLAELFHQPQNTEVYKNDWVRAGKFLSGTWPIPLPKIREWIFGVSVWDGYENYRGTLAIDTEYNPETKDLLTLGIGGHDLPIIQWWPHRVNAASRVEVGTVLKYWIYTNPVVFQNCFADLPVLKQALGIDVSEFKQIEELIFLDSVLWCELPHNLAFVASMTGSHEKLKHLPMTDPRYNAGDVAETLNAWRYRQREVSRDPQSEWIYTECMLPLIPIILEAQHFGIKVDREKVREAEQLYLANRAYSQELAHGYSGFPLNLGSPGEAGQLATLLSYELKRKIKAVDEDSIATLRGEILPFDPQEEVTRDSVQRRISEGGHPLLEARVLYARAQQYLSHYVEPMLASLDGRVHASFHPWAQNTGRWSTVDPPLAQLPHSLRDALVPDTGWLWFEFDWSQIELRLIAALAHDAPLLETFTKEWDLHTVHMCQFFGYLLPPHPTKAGLQYVKGACEECRQLAYDLELARQIEDGMRLIHPVLAQRQTHILRGCTEAWASLIGFQGGDDPRRVFAKTAVFRLCYGGTPEGAPSIPGAMSLGLKPSELVAASRRWINAHPAIKRFWQSIAQQALVKRQLRTFLGRRWNFLSHDRKRIQRQMYDFPMQGAVADIMNLTLIRIKSALGARVRLAYTMHDSIKLVVRETPSIHEDLTAIREIAQAEWDVSGITMRFPAEFKERRVGWEN